MFDKQPTKKLSQLIRVFEGHGGLQRRRRLLVHLLVFQQPLDQLPQRQLFLAVNQLVLPLEHDKAFEIGVQIVNSMSTAYTSISTLVKALYTVIAGVNNKYPASGMVNMSGTVYPCTGIGASTTSVRVHCKLSTGANEYVQKSANTSDLGFKDIVTIV